MKLTTLAAAFVAVVTGWASAAHAQSTYVTAKVSAQEIRSYCPSERIAIGRAIDQDQARFAQRLTPGADLSRYRTIASAGIEATLDQHVSFILSIADAQVGPGQDTKVLSDMDAELNKVINQYLAEEGQGQFRPLAMQRAQKVYLDCSLQTYFARSRAAYVAEAKRAAEPTSASSTQDGSGQGASCVRLEPRQNSNGFWNAINGCAYKVSGNYCFEEGGSTGCQSRVPPAFGPINAGGTSMIHGPDTTGHPPDQVYHWKVAYCDYDAWTQGRCKPAPLN